MGAQPGSNFLAPPINFISKSEYVYRSLRGAILNGVIKPGSFLNQAELAEQIQVSRMPIRDAINMLAREGLVRIILHKGAKVTHFSPKDIQEIYAIRKILEGYAIREATPHIKKDLLSRLEEINHNINKHAQKRDVDAMIKENERFHLLLYEPCQNQRLVELIQNLWSSYPKRIFWEIKGRAEQVVNQHKEILAAVRAGNPEKAEKLIRANLILSPKAIERMASALGS
ncbi:MAG: GntR family transcriptional regulator [Deltaproteobacteria bacterium]|jgi:DNA-binding GntR family transcriptional regulator|nr:GntR family transcriptional regulator [Deltaproteobacteria bacterium]